YGLGENYSNNYNPTLNASNDYTFQTKRDKSESNNAKEQRDSEVLIAEECIERDFSFCSAVQSDTETLSHYHQRIDEMCYPMQNILLNHPHFNVENAEYQRTNNKHLLQMGTDVSKRNVLTIPMNCIQVPLVSEPKVSIIAAADTMSDIDCMGINPTMYYRNKGLICYDSKGISVMTGNGKFRVHCYVPIRLKCENGNEIKRKFWCLENLPTYDWLIGKHTLPEIGYTLQRTYCEYVHNPTNIDNVDGELDDLLCSNYPLVTEPKLDFSDLKIENEEFRAFVIAQLQQYETVVARHEFDSGTLRNMEFQIDLKPEERATKEGFVTKEYFMNAQNRKETQIQLNGLQKFGLISELKTAKYISALFSVPKKTGDVRIVFDYRRLNAITVRNRYPIPTTPELLAKFKGKSWISSLDLKGGYWHIPIKES
ncbi:MAG: hypothetical protein GY941_30240, partial [Planctomycetes bacterium]|nr:hypothetical protein [Planctomycetota bacterium]